MLSSSFRLYAKASKLAAIIAVAMFLTSMVNRSAGIVLERHLSSAAWIATAAIPSAAVIALSYIWLGSPSLLRWPPIDQQRWREVVRRSVVWLLFWIGGLIATSVFLGHWMTYAVGPALIVAFVVFGPIGEELLFRGVVFDTAKDLFPRTDLFPIIISAATFSLHHVQLHEHPFRALALAQLFFTFPMGIVFARLRVVSESLWPPFILHVLTNLPAAI